MARKTRKRIRNVSEYLKPLSCRLESSHRHFLRVYHRPNFAQKRYFNARICRDGHANIVRTTSKEIMTVPTPMRNWSGQAAAPGFLLILIHASSCSTLHREPLSLSSNILALTAKHQPSNCTRRKIKGQHDWGQQAWEVPRGKSASERVSEEDLWEGGFQRFSEVLRSFQSFSEVFRGFQRFYKGPLRAPLRVPFSSQSCGSCCP